MNRPAVSGPLVRRAMLSVLFGAGLILGAARTMPPNAAEAASTVPAARSTLRVGMWTLWHDREVVLTAAGPNHKVALRSCAGCATFALNDAARLKADGGGLTLTIPGKTEHIEKAWITGAVALTAHGETVTLENPLTIAAREGVLSIVVTLPVESYVERVVASESGPDDSAESLKALAIVVRTFALHENHGHPEYDLCDSTHCQLLHWGGNREREAEAHAATLATGGETLWFHGQRALGYFNKDCGGRTASPAEIWTKAKPLPYLPSLPDSYCTADGGKEWATELTRAELTAALAARGLARPGWNSLTVARRGESGRTVTLRLGATEISAEEFRLAVGKALGWNRVPSTWFEVNQQGDRFEFHGRGWGHGVGLCQKGAAVMAAQGRRSALQVLEKYFPGTQAADEATGQAWNRSASDGFTLESLNAGDAAYLPELARARAEAVQRSGLNARDALTVRAFASTEAFREATLAPGWVAAFTEGRWIGTQPMRTLAARQLLAGTMRHEFLHALVEQQAGARAPLWLREGLVEEWSDADSGATSPRADRAAAPALKIDAVDSALANAASEAELEAAHRAAAWYAARLLDRYGREQVLEWLRSGLPAGAVVAIGQR